MSILLLSQFFRPVIGGEERAVEDLAVGLVQRGHSVSVATLAVPGAPAYEELDGVRVHRLEATSARATFLFSEAERTHLPPLPDPGIVAGLRRVLARERPELVHAHNWIVHSFLPLKRKTGPRLVLSLHDYSLVCATKRFVYAEQVCDGPAALKCSRCAAAQYGRLKGGAIVAGLRAMRPLVYRGVDLFLPVSATVADRLALERRGLRYTVIPNIRPQHPSLAPTGADDLYLDRLPSGGYLLFLGDVTADKGALVLEQAYARLEQSPPLVFIGRPFDLPAGSRGCVHVLGAWPHPLALEAVRRATVVVVPSVVPETFGIGALEAMSFGKPVVASRIGGLAELVVDGVTGRLVDPGDPAALASALAAVLADSPALAAMSAASMERAELYSADRVLPRLEEVYRALARNPDMMVS